MQISTKGKNAIKMLLDLSNHNDGTPVRLRNHSCGFDGLAGGDRYCRQL